MILRKTFLHITRLQSNFPAEFATCLFIKRELIIPVSKNFIMNVCLLNIPTMYFDDETPFDASILKNINR